MSASVTGAGIGNLLALAAWTVDTPLPGSARACQSETSLRVRSRDYRELFTDPLLIGRWPHAPRLARGG
jgi:hypothetical protein